MIISRKELIQFEEDIKDIFLKGEIKAPVHLCGGNEDQLIEIFSLIQPDDWVFSTHRSHYHALLKGIPPEWVKAEILAGRSISINNRKHKFFSSAIVGGNLPIALGVALAIKRRKGTERVWAFLGDMASETGIAYECRKYAEGFDLPITFIVEDNGLSVNTPTGEAWGYKYERTYPHQGAGQWVEFK